MAMIKSRRVEALVVGRVMSDGAGVRLTRVLGGDLQRRLDPFLMLDAFSSENPADYLGGFPDHPHRGFEAITYMIAGRMRHRDSARNEGVLQGGGMQWMTVGRGVIHSEFPEQESGLLEGFQLWLNLPARDKMQAPWYRDFSAQEIPEMSLPGGGRVRVLAGQFQGVAGAVRRAVTEPLYLDVHLPAGSEFVQPIPSRYNAFLYVYRGSAEVAGQSVPPRQMALLDNSADAVQIKVGEASCLLLLAGYPLGEPIAQLGPFVMNTEAEVRQAVADYHSGRLGR